MREALALTEEATTDLQVVAIRGELDVINCAQLRDLLDTPPYRETLVVVDLAQVTFIDSAALGVLIGALKQARRSGGDVRLVSGEAKIVKTFEITGLTDRFSIYPTVEDATGHG